MIKDSKEYQLTLDYYRQKIEEATEVGNVEDAEVFKHNLDFLTTSSEEKIKGSMEKAIELGFNLPLAGCLYKDTYYRNLFYNKIRETKKLSIWNLINCVGAETLFKDDDFINLVFEFDKENIKDVLLNNIYFCKIDVQKKFLDICEDELTNVFVLEWVLQKCSDEFKDYFCTKKKLCEIILDSFGTDLEKFGFSVNQQNLIWENTKNYVKNKSINEQVLCLKKFTDNVVKQKIIDELNLIEFIYVNSYNSKDILDTITDEEELFAIAQKGDISILKNILPKLSIDKQKYILDNNPDVFQSYLTEILLYVDGSIQQEYFLKNLDYYTFTRTFDLYKKTKNTFFLNFVKDYLLSKESLDNFIVILINQEFIDLLTEEEQIKIANKITWPSKNNEVREIVNCNLQDGPVTRKIIDNFIYNMDNFNNYNINNTSTFCKFVKNYIKEEYIELLLRKMSKSDLIELSITEDFCVYVLDILKNEPNYFENVKINSVYTNSVASKASLMLLSTYLTDEQKINLFSNRNILEQKELKAIYMSALWNNLELINNYSQINLLDFNEQLKILDYMSVDRIFNIGLAYFDKSVRDNFIKNKIEEIYEEIPKLNNKNIFCFFGDLKYFDIEQRHKIINLMPKKYLINLLKSSDCLTVDDKKIIIDLIIDYEIMDVSEINDYNSIVKTLTVDNLNYFCEKMSIPTLINFYTKTKMNSLEELIMNKLRESIDYLGHPNCFNNCMEFFSVISQSNREYIINEVNNIFNSINLSDDIKDKVIDNSIHCKLSLIYAYNHGYLDKDKGILFKELLDKDKFLLYNLDFRLFDDNILKIGKHFVSKTSRYPEIVKDLNHLFKYKPNEAKLLSNIIEELLSKEDEIIFDQKISKIITYLVEFDDIKLLNIRTSDVSVIANYIIEKVDSLNDKNSILHKLDCDVDEYYNERVKLCDDIIKNSNNIEELKNAYFTRYYWRSSSQIEEFLIGYAYGYDDNVKLNASSYLPEMFISNINKIKDIQDPQLIKELYYSGTIEYSISDFMTIIGIMTNAYNKTFEQDFKKELQGSNVHKEFEVDGIKYNFDALELTNDLGLFIHSTNAYGNMPMINNDYFESWNNNTNTANHGVCSCYITEKSMGIPPVCDNGVLFGFTNINSSSINMMAPYDLITRNNGYNITSARNPMYLRLDKVSEYTRHTHNEFSLERRNSIDGKFPCLQPDCVVILEDMPPEIKKNTLKAVEDFKKQGIDLKIYYIDRIKILKQAGEQINSKIDSYYQMNDLNILKDIINDYESLRCSSDFIKDINIEDVLNKNKISNLLHNTADELLVNNDKSVIRKFIEIMKHEQFKFDLIEENVGNRAHKFDLLDDNLKEKIVNLNKVLDEKEVINEFRK